MGVFILCGHLVNLESTKQNNFLRFQARLEIRSIADEINFGVLVQSLVCRFASFTAAVSI